MPVKTMTLVKIAAVGGMVLVGSTIGMKYFILRRFQQSEYFLKSARIVLENKRLVELLGEPVQFGNPDLSESRINYATITEARFEIPIKGSKKKGFLHLHAERETQFTNENETKNSYTTGSETSENVKTIPHWEIRKLELSLDDKPDRKIDLVQLALSSQKNMPNSTG